MDYKSKMVDIESDDDIGEGFGAQAGEIPEAIRRGQDSTLRSRKKVRLDAYIGEATDLSRSYAQNLTSRRSSQRLWQESCQEVQIMGGAISIPEAKS